MVRFVRRPASFCDGGINRALIVRYVVAIVDAVAGEQVGQLPVAVRGPRDGEEEQSRDAVASNRGVPCRDGSHDPRPACE